MKRYISFPFFVGLFVCLGFLAVPVKSKASLTTMSQREYIQWMVQLTGDSGMFDTSSTDEDYIKWAEKQKMKPKDSQSKWGDLDRPMTRELLAETLAQFFKLGKPKKGMDYARLLLLEGIELPDVEVLTREVFMMFVDDFGFSSRISCISNCSQSPSKPSKKKSKFQPPKPPKPPKVKTPKKPTKKDA